MVAIILVLVMLVAPFVLWLVELNTLVVLVGIYVALSTPSIIHMFYQAIKSRTWPKIVGGPSIMWAGKRIGF